MALELTQQISTSNIATGTHEDVYGVGGYRSVTTGVAPATTATSANINAQVLWSRRKVGMLVFDVSSQKYYRCTSRGTPQDGSDGAWSEAFTGGFPGAENYVQRSELPLVPGGTEIDVASQTSVDAVLATAARVLPDNSVQVLVGGQGITVSGSWSTKTITVSLTELNGGDPNAPV